MPILEYECGKCGKKFEVLKNTSEVIGDITECMHCGGEAKKLLSAFAHKVSGGSINESVDMTIGREAEDRWSKYHEKQAKRRKKLQDIPVDQPKTKDGKFMPIMALGNKKEKTQRRDYASALQEHRTDRKKKGQGQFDGPGVF